MESELQQSYNLENQSRASRHEPALQMTKNEFASTLDYLDQGKDIRWKKELASKPEGLDK